MKKLKILPSILMLVLCAGVLGVGVFAITPTNNTISGQISIHAGNNPVKIELLKDDVLVKTHPEVRAGVCWDLGEFAFNTENANVIEDVKNIELTIRITNLSDSQGLGAYFYNGNSLKNGYATGECIMTESEVYDKSVTTDKIADVFFTPYTYIHTTNDTTNVRNDVVDMKITFSPYELYSDKKENTFEFVLNIENYVADNITFEYQSPDAELSETGPIYVGNFENTLLKLPVNIAGIPIYHGSSEADTMELSFNSNINYIVIPYTENLVMHGDGSADYYTAQVSSSQGLSINVEQITYKILYEGGEEIFDYNLVTTTFNSKFVYFNAKDVPQNAFFDADKLRNIYLSNYVQTIGDFALAETDITNITIPSSVTSIQSEDGYSNGEYSAFYGCVFLTEVIVKKGTNLTEPYVLPVRNEGLCTCVWTPSVIPSGEHLEDTIYKGIWTYEW